jgi:OmpA-OmpF porin, OOP family
MQSKYLKVFQLALYGTTIGLLVQACSSIKNAGVVKEETTVKKTGGYKTTFDFVAGQKLLWSENFAQSVTGNFPKGWNTNASAEVVDNEDKSKALLITKDGVYIPLGVTNLPAEFTLQFDLSCSSNYSYYSSPFQVMFASLASKKEFTVLKQYNPHNKDVVKVWLHPHNAASNGGYSGYELFEKGVKQSSNESNTSQFFASGGPASVKVSIWREKQSLRVYFNEEKVWDLPQAFDETANYNSLVFGISHLVDHTGKYYISNIKLATDIPKQQKN